jgi:hypothetical protein
MHQYKGLSRLNFYRSSSHSSVHRFLLYAVLLSTGFIYGCSGYQPHQVSRVGEPQENLVSDSPNQFHAVSGRYDVTLDIKTPPLQMGEKETMIVRLRNARTNEPIVIRTLEVQALQQENNEAPQEPISKAQWVNAVTDVERMTEPGAYRVSATFPEDGKWHIQVLPHRIPQRETSRLIYFHVNVQDS